MVACATLRSNKRAVTSMVRATPTDDADRRCPPTDDALPCFRLDEVARHCTPDDCWVIWRGDVYDVTAFVPRHPGGGLIHANAGNDCTQLFDSYHPLSAR